MDMARMTRLETIENQIKKKQEKLFELKDKSDAISAEIQELLKEREIVRKENLLKELEASGRTYEEIVEYLRSAPKRNTVQSAPKRKYRPRKAKTTN